MNLSIDHLPPIARELVSLIDLPATLRLVEAYGGRHLEIPRGKRMRGTAQIQAIAERIGALAAKKIVGRYAGTVLYVPKCHAALRAHRDAQLQARFDELTGGGLSARRAVAQLVGEFHLVETTVWRALKRPVGDAAIAMKVTDDRQAGLF